MSARGELLVPEGWTPKRGARVSVLATKEQPAIPGRWYLIDRAPGGWWAQPTDDAARRWVERNPNAVTMEHLEVAGRRLVPFGHQPATRAGVR